MTSQTFSSSRDAFEEPVRTVILGRRSCRSFTAKPVSEKDLDRILEAGIFAPSGSNAQNQRFIVLTDPADIRALGRVRFVWPYPSKKDMSQIVPEGIIGRATAVVAVFADACRTDRRNRGEYFAWEVLETQNCAASIENMLLMSTALGLGSCWVSASQAMNHTRMLLGGRWREAFPRHRIPETCKIQGLVLLGHPQHRSESGFADGERMHGTDWQQVRREENEAYILPERGPADEPPVPPLPWRLSLLRLALRAALHVTQSLDRAIGRIELKRLS